MLPPSRRSKPVSAGRMVGGALLAQGDWARTSNASFSVQSATRFPIHEGESAATSKVATSTGKVRQSFQDISLKNLQTSRMAERPDRAERSATVYRKPFCG